MRVLRALGWFIVGLAISGAAFAGYAVSSLL
jgi:hypothetical protein